MSLDRLKRRFIAVCAAWMLAAGLCAPVAVAQTPATADLNSSRRLVVMLRAADASGATDNQFCAAGILLARSRGRTLVLTARHVVDRLKEDDGAGLNLTAEFRDLPGAAFQIRELPGISDRRLDYAVIEVLDAGKLTAAGLPDLAVLGHVQKLDGTLKRVRPIGQVKCTPWSAPATSEAVMSQSVLEIVFETRYAEEGASGGGLFGDDGTLIGMIIEVDGVKGVARPIGLILEQLQAKNVEFDLKNRPVSKAEIDEVIQAARATVRNTLPRSPEQASQVKLTRLPIKLDYLTGEDEASFTINTSQSGVQGVRQMTVHARDGSTVAAGARFMLPLAAALSEGVYARVEFRDGTTIEKLPVDTRGAIQAEVAALFALPPQKWIGYNPDSVGPGAYRFDTHSSAFRLFRKVKVGFAKDKLVYTLNRDGEAAYDKTADVYAIGRHHFFRPEKFDRIYYQIEAVDGTLGAVGEFAPDKALLKRRIQQNTTNDFSLWTFGAGAPSSPFFYAFNGGYQSSKEQIRVYLPPSLESSKLEYDIDGKGFLPAPTSYPQYAEFPWPTEPFQIRVRTAGDAVAGPFKLPAPSVDAILASVPLVPPSFQCGSPRRDVPPHCYVPELVDLVPVRAIEASFQSQTALRPLKFSDVRGKYRTPEGRKELWACYALNSPDCLARWLQAGGAVPIPDGATDFYYRTTLIDGSVSDVVRVPLPAPPPAAAKRR